MRLVLNNGIGYIPVRFSGADYGHDIGLCSVPPKNKLQNWDRKASILFNVISLALSNIL
jgi:hypothetical protein